MNNYIKMEIKARMILVRAYSKEGWSELAIPQIKLIKKGVALNKYLEEKNKIEKTDKIIYLKAA